MTDDVKRFTFLMRQKPICTQSPIKSHLGGELHRELRAKYKYEMGIDLLDDRCPNSFNCKTINKNCIGRPFPIDSDIKKALDSINVNVTIGNYKGLEVYMAEALVECNKCPFREGCENSCPTQDSFLRRSAKPESNPPEASLVSYDDYEKGLYRSMDINSENHCEYGDWIDESLPLDCLTSRQREVMELHLYNNLDQVEIAIKLGITQQVVSKHLSRARTKLKEFGIARKYINKSKLVPRLVLDYYLNNLTKKEIADKNGVSNQYISKSIKEWYNSISSK